MRQIFFLISTFCFIAAFFSFFFEFRYSAVVQIACGLFSFYAAVVMTERKRS